MSLLRAKNGGAGGIDGRASDMPTMRPVTMGRPLVTMSTYEERGETLKRTSFMPDDSCYRNNNNNSSNNNGNNGNNIANNGSNRNSNNNNNNNMNGTPELPPPPAQFANPLKLNIPNGNRSKQLPSTSQSQSQSTSQSTSPSLLSPVRSPSINVGGLRAPATPQPDYEAATVQLRSNATTTTTTAATTSTNGSQQQQRRTLRLGTVTIGEYGEQQRGGGKRETLRKVPSIGSGNGGSSAQTNGILKNGRSSANFSNNNSNGSSSSNNNSRQQMQQLEKSIKFGN